MKRKRPDRYVVGIPQIGASVFGHFGATLTPFYRAEAFAFSEPNGAVYELVELTRKPARKAKR